MIRCISMPFGVNTPQQCGEDEGSYYTEVYQLDIAPDNKQIYKTVKNQESIIGYSYQKITTIFYTLLY